MVFAYLLENHPVFGMQARNAYETLLERGDRLCTSTFTLGELLVRPRKVKDQRAIAAIRSLFDGGEIETIAMNLNAADHYSILRADTNVKAADGIHLACAIEAKVDLFVTNDRELLRLRIPRIPFLVGLDGRVF